MIIYIFNNEQDALKQTELSHHQQRQNEVPQVREKKITPKVVSQPRLPLPTMQTKRINMRTLQRLTCRPQHPTP